MPTAVEFNLGTREIREIPLQGLALEAEDPQRIYWIDADRRDPEALARLVERLAPGEEERRQLCGEVPMPGLPGLIERADSLTLTLESWRGVPGEGRPDRFTLHLTRRYCLTLSSGPVRPLEELREIHRREFQYAQSPGFLLFLLLDSLVEDLARATGPIDVQCEAIGERIYGSFDPEVNQEILALKRRLLALKRSASHLRDDLMRLSGRRIPVITEAGRQSLGDVFHHAQALTASLDSQRELASSLLDSYMSVQAQRLNETMKVLTIFASIVLPMTLVAGLYGMNFVHMPETGWRYGYYWAIGLMLVAGLSVLLFFRRRGWV